MWNLIFRRLIGNVARTINVSRHAGTPASPLKHEAQKRKKHVQKLSNKPNKPFINEGFDTFLHFQ